MTSSTPPHRYDVLIVEDNDADAELIAENISSSDLSFTMRRATTFEEGERLIHEKAPDAVLLDLNLPDSRAETTVGRLQQVVQDEFPIIIMTGLDDQVLVRAAFDLGVQEYLIKDKLSLPASNGSSPAASVAHLTAHAIERHRVMRARIKASRLTGSTDVMGPEGLAAREAIRETQQKASMARVDDALASLRRLASG